MDETTNDPQMSSLIKAWVAAADASKGTSEYEANSWAINKVYDYEFDDPEQLWRFIHGVSKLSLTERAEALLAADPIENLLHKYGAQFIDRIEKLARDDEHFRDLLNGVWYRDTVPDDVWSRFEALRKGDDDGDDE